MHLALNSKGGLMRTLEKTVGGLNDLISCLRKGSVLLAGVVLLPFAAYASEQFTAEELVTQTFPANAKQVIVEMFNGNIQVVVSSSKSIKADVTKRGSGLSLQEAKEDLKNIEVKMVLEKDTLRITGRRLVERDNAFNSGTSAKLNVPAGMVLELRSSNGNITANGSVGKVVANTTNGAIEIESAQGPLNCTTSNGAITVKAGKGQIAAETSNGGIDIAAENAEVSAHTTNGQVTFSGNLKPGKQIFYTENGNITLNLPGKSSFQLDAETSNGSVTTDFTVAATESGDTMLRGSVGTKPQALLNLRTCNANIDIKKKE
jgi:hypothetical protein